MGFYRKIFLQNVSTVEYKAGINVLCASLTTLLRDSAYTAVNLIFWLSVKSVTCKSHIGNNLLWLASFRNGHSVDLQGNFRMGRVCYRKTDVVSGPGHEH
jgi:hypothetical protein